jgi:hypothetical protein
MVGPLNQFGERNLSDSTQIAFLGRSLKIGPVPSFFAMGGKRAYGVISMPNGMPHTQKV